MKPIPTNERSLAEMLGTTSLELHQLWKLRKDKKKTYNDRSSHLHSIMIDVLKIRKLEYIRLIARN